MSYLTGYYWFTAVVFFVWIILHVVGTCISVEHDSYGDPIQSPTYKTKQQILRAAHIFMWIFIVSIFLFFLFLFFLIPIDKHERANTFPFNMIYGQKEKIEM
jgi:magnesium-transporting ATPase (P-type)